MPSRTPVRFMINLKTEPSLRGEVDGAPLRAAARAALDHGSAPAPAELTVLITGDDALQALNRQFLGHDEPTDVLSFPSTEADPDTGRRYLGDIAISLAAARRQAQEGGHATLAELQLLVVHGTLHLLGHDHAVAAQKKRMWAAQAEILTSLDAGITGPADED